MNRHAVISIATKDLGQITRKRSVRTSLVLFPLLVALGLALVVRLITTRGGGVSAAELPGLLDGFTFFFVVGAASLPTAIASYSLVGEKLEHSLEPLLAAPVTDGEILLGKCLAAVLPPLAAIYAGVAVFMTLCDLATHQLLGRLYFPNWTAAVILVVVVPLSAAMCVEFNVVISARVGDVRAAQQLGALAVIPFAATYVGSEIGLVTFDGPTLAAIAGVLLIVDAALFSASRATFQREQILTRWR